LPEYARGPQGRVVAISSFGALASPECYISGVRRRPRAALETLVKCRAIELARPQARRPMPLSPGYTRKDAGRMGALDQASWQLAAKAIRSVDWPNPTR